jgi:hypothetical protein
MKYSIRIAIIFILFSNYAESFDGLLFKPLTANIFEPRIGSQYEFGDKKLRLDIGGSVDLFETNWDKMIIRFGTDFFTFTRLRSEGNLKFPVETSDYFFGINTSTQLQLQFPVSFRLRIAHISSHLVDGMAIDTIFTRKPYVYSREFADLVIAFGISHRIYFGFTGVFSTQPKNVQKIIPQFGIDWKEPLTRDLDLRAGYDFKLNGYEGVNYGNNSAQIGIEYNSYDIYGLGLYIYYYSGKSIHGMFIRDYDNYFGTGFQVLFN